MKCIIVNSYIGRYQEINLTIQIKYGPFPLILAHYPACRGPHVYDEFYWLRLDSGHAATDVIN